MRGFFSKTGDRIKAYLSHRPMLYALIVGIGIVLFWRGVWHSVDFLHSVFVVFHGNFTTDLESLLWWDGPLSFVIGSVVLYLTGAFKSSFIGNELILSGLRGEKRLSEKTETEVKTEEQVIVDIKDELNAVTEELEELGKDVHRKHVEHK